LILQKIRKRAEGEMREKERAIRRKKGHNGSEGGTLLLNVLLSIQV